ncbi:MAG: hypothetical protein ACR2LF_03380 [Jatrophihabitantaceae bacterium]
MRVRKLSAAATVLLAAVGLTACQSKVGAAAYVGGHRISDSEVASYVTNAGVAPSIAAKASASGETLQPKVSVLDLLVKRALFQQALRAHGGVPSQGKLAALHDTALETFLGLQPAQVTGFDAYLAANQGPNGYSSGYKDLLLSTVELETALAIELKPASRQAFNAAVDKLHIPVSVSPRYGAWDAANLQMSADPAAGVPSFVTLHSSAAPAAAAPSG